MEILLLGKGPSAARIGEHLDVPVAVINDAMKLFDGPVRYCFFSDIELIESCREHWHRVKHFVSPDRLHKNFTLCDAENPIKERLTTFPYSLSFIDEDVYRERVKNRQMIHHPTASGAMCWLAYAGYARIKMLGFDGGVGLVGGVHAGGGLLHNYDDYLRSQKVLERVLFEEIGVQFKWL